MARRVIDLQDYKELRKKKVELEEKEKQKNFVNQSNRGTFDYDPGLIIDARKATELVMRI